MRDEAPSPFKSLQEAQAMSDALDCFPASSQQMSFDFQRMVIHS